MNFNISKMVYWIGMAVNMILLTLHSKMLLKSEHI